MFAFLVPASLRDWFSSNVQARAERLFAIADRQLDQMEAELADRQTFTLVGTAPSEPTDEAAPTNRIADIPVNGNGNGRRKTKASL